MTSTLSPPSGRVATGPLRRPRRTADPGTLLAFAAPLALFVHGILRWVDALDAHTGTSPLGIAAGAVLVAAVAGFAWLTVRLGARAEHLPVGVPASLLAAFGAGATGAVWVGTTVGLLDEAIPSALAVGGPLLVGVALATTLGALTIEARMPLGSLMLAGAGAATLMLPWDLLPLGALLLLIAFGPLTRPADSGRSAHTAVR
jgi:hypothetical protein